MAVRAARRALTPADAAALEALGFSRQWPVFIERRGLWPRALRYDGPHLIAHTLGIGIELPPSADLSGLWLGARLTSLAQWPLEGERAFELEQVGLLRRPGHLMVPRASAHAYLLEGKLLPEECAVRVLISSDGFEGPRHIGFDERAPIYTQVEWGRQETDLDRFWSYSRKGL